jgi:hypothetical protein
MEQPRESGGDHGSALAAASPFLSRKTPASAVTRCRVMRSETFIAPCAVCHGSKAHVPTPQMGSLRVQGW